MKKQTIIVSMERHGVRTGVKVMGYACTLAGFPAVVHHPVKYIEHQKAYMLRRGWRCSDVYTGRGYSGGEDKKTRAQAIAHAEQRIRFSKAYRDGTLGSTIMQVAAELAEYDKIIDLTGD